MIAVNVFPTSCNVQITQAVLFIRTETARLHRLKSAACDADAEVGRADCKGALSMGEDSENGSCSSAVLDLLM